MEYQTCQGRICCVWLKPFGTCLVGRLLSCMGLLHKSYTVAALIIEPLGSIKPKIAEQSLVFSPKMLDPSGSIIGAAMVHLDVAVACQGCTRGGCYMHTAFLKADELQSAM
jgi:hypothetical protein